MYEYIKGYFAGINNDYIIVENNGIGYKIYTSGSTIEKLPKLNEEIKLYVKQIVREDFIGLYGFLTNEELEMFNMLLGINGVGAKAALSLLSISTVSNLKKAIKLEDEVQLTKAPGIGKKTGQRIILELKDKVDYTEDFGEEKLGSQKNEEVLKDALNALLSLGYSEREAKKAVSNSNKDDSLENIIKSCLKSLMN